MSNILSKKHFEELARIAYTHNGYDDLVDQLAGFCDRHKRVSFDRVRFDAACQEGKIQAKYNTKLGTAYWARGTTNGR